MIWSKSNDMEESVLRSRVISGPNEWVNALHGSTHRESYGFDYGSVKPM